MTFGGATFDSHRAGSGNDHVTEKETRRISRRCSLSAYAIGDGEGSQRWNDNDTGTYALAAIVLIAEMAHCRPDSRELM